MDALPLQSVTQTNMAQPRKPKLGQNFLTDDAARHRIAYSLGDIAHRTVVEIGPGHGAITSILAERAQRLICIELDRALAAELTFHYRNHPNVQIVEADILHTNLSTYLQPGETADVIGNLPYYITSDILLHLFAQNASLRMAVIMMQREVADRISATPGTRDFGLLSATAQMYTQVDNLFTLPPTAFTPAPDVYSSVLRLIVHPRFAELHVQPAAFNTFLKSCFQQKRKTLFNNLRAGGVSADRIDSACKAADLSPTLRAEAMSLEQLAAVHRALETPLADSV